MIMKYYMKSLKIPKNQNP